MTQQNTVQKVDIRNKLALGIGFFAMFFANQSIAVLAIPFYQMILGVDPFLLGLALTIPVIVCTILGPWVGHLSDNFNSAFGRRRPFIFVGSWLSCFTFGAIWMVSPLWSESIQLMYFVVCSLLFNISVVFLSVPLTCLSYEMSDDHHQRTEIMGFTSYFIKIGSLLYQWLFPLSQLAIFGSIFIGIKSISWGVAIFIIGLLGCIPSFFCHEKAPRKQFTASTGIQRKQSLGLFRSLATLKNNKALFVLLILTALQLCGGAFTASMDYYLVVYYQHSGDVAEGSIWKGVLSTSYAAFGLLTIPLIAKLSATYGKVNALKTIYLITAFGGVLKWFIFTPDVRWLLILDAAFCTAIWTAMTMLIPSMLADLCDEDEVLHQQRREGLFVSLHTWVVNFSMAAALLFSGLTLNIIGFNAANHMDQTNESLLSMRLILSVGTVLFSLLPLYFIRFYHIDAKKCLETKHKLALKRLEDN
ncbi:MAG: MFS transporter [Colwellia sp.]